LSDCALVCGCPGGRAAAQRDDGTYPGYQADLAWFNWTSIEVGVPAGAEVNVPLEVNIPGGESGYNMFYAKLESTKWTPTAVDTGILYII